MRFYDYGFTLSTHDDSHSDAVSHMRMTALELALILISIPANITDVGTVIVYLQ